MNTIAGVSTTSPTSFIKKIDTVPTPDIQQVDDSAFKRFVYTGYTVTIDLPLVKNSKNPIFGINIDGFNPGYNLGGADVTWASIQQNLCPVQVLAGVTGVAVSKEEISNPIDTMYLSHRFMSGNVGIGLRIASNTAQAGNFLVAQGHGMTRGYYRRSEQYAGLRITNSTAYTTDYAMGNFAAMDISLDRTLSITTSRKDPNKVTDLAKKIFYVSNVTGNNAVEQVMATQFMEDWILFAPLTTLPNPTPNQLYISVFFDYSNIQFFVPMIPKVSLAPGSVGRQILRWTANFMNRNAATAAIGRGQGNWLPGDTFEGEEEDEEQLVSQLTKLNGLTNPFRIVE